MTLLCMDICTLCISMYVYVCTCKCTLIEKYLKIYIKKKSRISGPHPKPIESDSEFSQDLHHMKVWDTQLYGTFLKSARLPVKLQ